MGHRDQQALLLMTPSLFLFIYLFIHLARQVQFSVLAGCLQ